MVDIELHTKKVGGGWERQDPLMYGWLPEPNLERMVRSPPVGRSVNKRERSESQSPNQMGRKVLNYEEVNLDETVWDGEITTEDRKVDNEVVIENNTEGEKVESECES